MRDTQFDDIRPFDDDEVEVVLQRLLDDDDFIRAIARQRFGRLEPLVAFAAHPFIRYSLKPQLKTLTSIKIIQHKVKRYLKRMIRRTTDGFTVSGLEALEADAAYLFISNHRDITLDPAFVNYALFDDGRETIRIAIGDNLLSKPYVSDLMRLNKSFIVKRSVTAPREMLTNFKILSSYIQHSLIEDNNPIWIAQAEGRAKDGNDKTHPAIIKMIAMSKSKEETFGEYINRIKIVPVSISYELDPNDAAKAKEVYIVDKHGEYRKAENEDVLSITRGIKGDKGKVHLSFGNRLEGDFKNANEVATEIDRQIIGNYQLHSSNYFAYKMLYGKYPDGFDKIKDSYKKRPFEKREEAFVERMKNIPEKHRTFALKMYTNIIDNKLNL